MSRGQFWSLLLTALFIVGLITVTFLFSDNKFVITGSIITLVCLLLIVVLSNLFDNFSVGQLITISREVKEKDNKIQNLENERRELYNNILKLSISNSNTGNNLNIINDPKALKYLIKSADKDDEKEKMESEDVPEKIERFNYVRIDSNGQSAQKHVNYVKLEELILKKGVGVCNFENIRRDIKMIEQFQGTDTISTKSVLFDGYLQDKENEIFMEVKSIQNYTAILHDRLYVQLNRVLGYKMTKNQNTQMLLFLAKIDEKELGFTQKLRMDFSPAIQSGLFKVIEVSITKEEYESCLGD